MDTERANRNAALNLENIDAVILDMDGVVTSTAKVHASAWKEMFDEYLQERAERSGTEPELFDIVRDYQRYVDGKPRYEGAASFLESRGISMPFGDPADPPENETVCGLGNRKNRYFLKRLKERGASSFPSTVAFVEEMRRNKIRTAVISASRNARIVLESAEITDLFDVIVDGLEADRLGLEGKPEPDIFLEAARRLGVEPERAAVIEDALAGVRAARRGGFSPVIGISRDGQRDELLEWGAGVVIGDLSELRIETGPGAGASEGLPSALEKKESIFALLREKKPAIFLDYDGTLTPIVDRPEDAVMPERTRTIVERLARRWIVAIVSGRDLQDVKKMVGLENIIYAGSHGFDISGPDESFRETSQGERFLPSLEKARKDLEKAAAGIEGARVERKRFSIALHYRLV
ncbi:MAG TPA: trehalose-phosphatase, partial [Candidatus Eisenbacteria bacterium]|nr:trehalose-phosphatase [Candidatus Eisenbacteria bacterium]